MNTYRTALSRGRSKPGGDALFRRLCDLVDAYANASRGDELTHSVASALFVVTATAAEATTRQEHRLAMANAFVEFAEVETQAPEAGDIANDSD